MVMLKIELTSQTTNQFILQSHDNHNHKEGNSNMDKINT